MPIIAALPVVLIALLACLLVYAFATFGKAVIAILPDHGFPGIGTLKNLIALGINTAVNVVDTLLSPLMIHAVNFVMAPVVLVEKLINGIEAALAETATTLTWLVTVKIPAVLANAYDYTNQLVNAAESYSLGLYRKAEADLSKLYYRAVALAAADAAAVKAYAATGFANVVKDLSTLYARAVAVAAADAAAVKAYAATGFANVVNDLSVIYARATAYTDAKITALIGHVEQEVAAGVSVATMQAVTAAGILVTDVEQAATGALNVVWPDVVAGVQGAEGAITGGLDDILAGLRDIDLTLPKDLAGIAALTGTLAIPMLRYMEECGIPNCRNLSALGRDLQALLGMVEDASFLALIVGLVTDPNGTAQALNDDLSGLAGDTINAGKSLFGVS